MNTYHIKPNTYLALDDRREAFEKIEALKENYWLAVE